MRVEIEKYRGWMIYFDTDKETFTAYSDHFDREEKKQSFASVKKAIDEFIAHNVKFKPVWVETDPLGYRSKGKIKLIGLRKDGRFIFERDGKHHQLSSYDEKEYFIVDDANQPIFTRLKEIDEEINKLHKEKQIVGSKLKKVGLDEIKKLYTL